MPEDGFRPMRRKFLSDSAMVLAGVALSSIAPPGLRAAGLLAGDGARAGRPLPGGLPKGGSMLAARPDELGRSIFADVPQALRAAALQLRSLFAGIKPACRLSLTTDELRECLPYLESSGCAIAIGESPSRPVAFAQMSPQRRQEVSARPRVRVYLAKTTADAARLAKLESGPVDYHAVGLALGYPTCCVEAATQNDQLSFDEASGTWRQTNLNVTAVQASTAADFRCNQFLVESELYNSAPLSAVAHYPCRLDCSETVAVAQSVLECCARTWPVWTVSLCELLRAPVLYWPDTSWPSEHWDEYCGLALPGAREVRPGEWHSHLPSVRLGSDATPAGKIPESVVRVQAVMGQVLLQDAEGVTARHSFEKAGRPWIIDWRAGTVRRLGVTGEAGGAGAQLAAL